VKIKRLLENEIGNSNLFLRAIDTGSDEGRINLSIKDKYYGKISDRTFATLVFDKDFSIEFQKKIVIIFNKRIEKYRKQTGSLFLSNYRNNGRKRIGFKLAYRIISNILKELGE